MKGLIVATSNIVKQHNVSQCKALSPFLGMSLIERAMRAAVEGGISELFIVIPSKEQLKSQISRLAINLGISVTLFEEECKTPAETMKALFKAHSYFKERFLLMTISNIVEPSIIEMLISKPLKNGEIAMAVDTNTDNDLIDLSTVNRVVVNQGKVINYGKGVPNCHGFDTGVYVCTPVFFKALQNCIKENHFHITSVISLLAKHKRVRPFGVKQRFWALVKDQATMRSTENAFKSHYCHNKQDDTVTRYLFRPVNANIAKFLCAFEIHPNMITALHLGLGILTGLFLLTNGFFLAMIACLMFVGLAFIEGLDEHLTALKYQVADWRENSAVQFAEKYLEVWVLLCFTWHAFQAYGNAMTLIVGVFASIGFLLQKTWVKNQKLAPEFSVGRGILSVTLLASYIMNIPTLGLVLTALITNGLVIMSQTKIQGNINVRLT